MAAALPFPMAETDDDDAFFPLSDAGAALPWTPFFFEAAATEDDDAFFDEFGAATGTASSSPPDPTEVSRDECLPARARLEERDPEVEDPGWVWPWRVEAEASGESEGERLVRWFRAVDCLSFLEIVDGLTLERKEVKSRNDPGDDQPREMTHLPR
jgi:hypothetical protein